MDKQKLQQDINDLKAKLAEMEAELNKPEPVINYWQPNHGEFFYFIDTTGTVAKTKAWVDGTKSNTYRAFKTQEQAQAYSEYVKAEETLKAEIARINEGWWPDWNDTIQNKFSISFKTKENNLSWELYFSLKLLPNFMYLKSRDLAEQLIKTHPKELTTYLTY